MRSIQHLYLVGAAILFSSCHAQPRTTDEKPGKVADLLHAYHRLSVGMSKPEILEIVGAPDRTFTPKSHRLNMRFDSWRYDGSSVAGSDGSRHVTTVLHLQFPYLESGSPNARLVSKSYTSPSKALSERDESFHENAATLTR